MENDIINITINIDDENFKLSNSYIKNLCKDIDNKFVSINFNYESNFYVIKPDELLYDKKNNFAYTKCLDFYEYNIFKFNEIFSEENIYPLYVFKLLDKYCTNILVDYIDNCEKYDDKLYIFKDGIIQIYDKDLKPLLNNKYYYVGNAELNTEYNLIIVYDENNNYGIIDLDGGILLEMEYEYIEIFNDKVYIFENKLSNDDEQPSLILKISDLIENQKLENNINFLMKNIYEND